MATLQDQGSASNGSQRAHHLETVAGSFQHNQVFFSGVFFGPGLELPKRYLVEHFFHYGACGRWTTQGRRRETVRVRIKTDHPLDNIRIRVHLNLL
jgi:hypothetical protein